MYRLDSSGDSGEPCGIPHWLSRFAVVRRTLPSPAPFLGARGAMEQRSHLRII
nr:hypothetical protein [Candidatus Hamiltonella defensa]